MQSSGGMATIDSAAQRPVNLLMSGPRRRPASAASGPARMAGPRERRHARHRRHLGRHRRRGGRAAAHAPPARHEGRRLPGDGADGRHRHDRRRRRLDRLRRRGRRLPRRPAVRGRRPRPCLLRPRRHGADVDRRAAPARPAAARTAACSAATCAWTVELARGAMATIAEQLGDVGRGGRARRAADPEVRHDAGDRAELACGAATTRASSRSSRPAAPGPLFACDIALELEIPRVLVPPHPASPRRPGCSRPTSSTSTSRPSGTRSKTLDRGAAAARFDELSAQAVAQLDADRVPDDRRLVRRLADCRYAGQGYEVRFDVPAGAIDDAWVEELKDAFHAAHEREYGHRFDAEIEIVNVRVRRHRPHRGAALGARSEARRRRPARRADARARRRVRRRRRAERRATPFYDRDAAAGRRPHRGPAVIEQYDSTTVVPPGLPPRSTASATSSSTAARAAAPRAARGAGDADPDARDRRRLLGDRQGDVRRPLPDELLVDHPRVGGPRRRHLRPDGNELAESDSTPMFMGAMPKIVRA